MKRALSNCRIFDGDQMHSGLAVLLEDDRVSALVSESDVPDSITDKFDLEGHILAPGLIDIQVNGGGGVMFNDAPSVETIRAIGEAHRRFGTTGFLPTLISTDSATMTQAIGAVDDAIFDGVPGVLGIHLEGPHLNPGRRGIHHASRFSQIDESAFELLTPLQGGCTLLTIAPECTNPEIITRLTGQGVRVFGGHSDASYDETREALAAGLQGFTHLFNAMSPMESRKPGMVGAALEDDKSWCGLIADGQHIHPTVFSVAVAAKPRGYSLLVTDAMASVGSSKKTFDFDGMEIHVADGSCRLASGALAGSDLGMITAVRNAMRFARLELPEALRMASVYPAHALGLEDQLGYIRVGYRASFIEIDEELNLYRSWIDGEVCEE